MLGILQSLLWEVIRLLTGKRPVKWGAQKLRNDNAGSGAYNAPRSGGRRHRGIDVETIEGDIILAPYHMTIKNIEGAFAKSRTKGIEFQIHGHPSLVGGHIFYFEPYRNLVDQRILAGTPIGVASNMVAIDYPHLSGVMKNHIHIQAGTSKTFGMLTDYADITNDFV